MNKWLKRKDFEKTFLPLTSKGKQIWVIGRVKQLPYEIVEMALRLGDLDFINYIRMIIPDQCEPLIPIQSEPLFRAKVNHLLK